MKQIRAKILSNEEMAEDRFRIKLKAPSICRLAEPGQFVMVKCSEGLSPFLRRPFSFHRIEKDSFELLYQVVGTGTEELSQRKNDETLDIIAPIGNGFTINDAPGEALLIAGGIGVAPLLELGRRLKVKGSRLKVLLGTKTKSHILCVDDFKKLGTKIKIATEDGTKGYKGLATELLKKSLSTSHLKLNTVVYACGPKDMLKEIASIAKSKRIRCQISLEEKMGCGTGACLGCAVKTVTGFKRVCKDGPVFNAGDIIW